jgi:hypothetical protein
VRRFTEIRDEFFNLLTIVWTVRYPLHHLWSALLEELIFLFLKLVVLELVGVRNTIAFSFHISLFLKLSLPQYAETLV